MKCCARSTSVNDGAQDEDGKHYCSVCWQSWIDGEQRTRQLLAPINDQDPLLKSAVANPRSRVSVHQVLFDDDESVGDLEALVPANAAPGTLYLISRKLGLVFDSERHESGQLRRVGLINEERKDGVELDTSCHSVTRESFPFVPNPADHCETPAIAYSDVAPVLEWVANRLGRNAASLRIYDPYYCAGSVKKHLAKLGFAKVHNECEDFYANISNGVTPEYDILITNPPYVPTESRDHVESLLNFSFESGKPFLLLMPNYVYMKPYWDELCGKVFNRPRPFFLLPPKPREYVYESPSALRLVKSTQRKTSPFVTFWYCWLGKSLQGSFYREFGSNAQKFPRIQIACSEKTMPDSFKDSSDKSRKRKRDRLGKRKRA